MTPLDLHQVLALAAVVETGSFEAAAARLHVTPSAVSQRVKALERRTGSVLVRRARPCTATSAGLPLVRLAGQWSLLEGEARRAAGADGHGGTAGDGGPVALAVVVNADSLSTWFAPALVDLGDDVVVEVHREDQDHSARLLRDGTVMAAVTTDPEPVQGCAVRRLGAMRYLAVASPSYVARRLSDGPTATSLAAAPMLAFNRKDALQCRYLARLLPDGGAALDPPTHHVPEQTAFVELLRQGLAWGMAPAAAVADDVAAGRLVELSPGTRLDVELHWQHWRLASTTIERLTGAVLDAAAIGLQA